MRFRFSQQTRTRQGLREQSAHSARSLTSSSASSATQRAETQRGAEFHSPAEAFSYIVRWQGSSVDSLLNAIQCARRLGGRIMQEYLRNSIADLSRRVPMPEDIPLYINVPILAVDVHGRVLVGFEGQECVREISTIRAELASIREKSAPSN